MENSDITTTIINNKIKVKKPASEAQLRAAKKFYEKNKNSEEYKQKKLMRQRNFMKRLKILKSINKEIGNMLKNNIKRIEKTLLQE